MAATLVLGLAAAPVAEGEAIPASNQRQDTTQQARIAGARSAFTRVEAEYRAARSRAHALDLTASRATAAYRAALARTASTTAMAAVAGVRLALARAQFTAARERLSTAPVPHVFPLLGLSELHFGAANGTPRARAFHIATVDPNRLRAFYRARDTRRAAAERDGAITAELARDRQATARLDLRRRKADADSSAQAGVLSELLQAQRQALADLQAAAGSQVEPIAPYVNGVGPQGPATPNPQPARPVPPRPEPARPPHRPAPTTPGMAPGAAKAIRYAKAQLGKPYQWGATGPRSFDCSGLVMRSWQAGGRKLPRVASAQYLASKPVTRSALAPGDVVFWAKGSSPSSIYHDAIYLGNDKIIEAPEPGHDVRIVSLTYDGIPRFFAMP
jgi:cell wall-associated NlpC family hydrolase